MKIVAIKEKEKGELRCAITPETANLFVKKGFDVVVEKGIGCGSNFPDYEYERAGAKVSSVLLEILSDADIILKVKPSPLIDQFNEIEMVQKNSAIIGFMSPYLYSDYLNKTVNKNLSTIAMEFLPRISKAQGMDALSSQGNLAGYRAVIEAAYYHDRCFPMMMTAAGVINPVKVLVLGIGVAGLQAIATAKRLGAVVSAYDVRTQTKEQAESLGANFLYPKELSEDLEGEGGYAKEVTKDFSKIQDDFINSILGDFDVIITTAQVPGSNSPVLINKYALEKVKTGAVIVDMATINGGNVEESIKDKIVNKKGLKIIGFSELAQKTSYDASRLYAKNLFNLVDYAVQDGKLNLQDEMIEEMLIATDGKIINKKFKV